MNLAGGHFPARRLEGLLGPPVGVGEELLHISLERPEVRRFVRNVVEHQFDASAQIPVGILEGSTCTRDPARLKAVGEVHLRTVIVLDRDDGSSAHLDADDKVVYLHRNLEGEEQWVGGSRETHGTAP